jgi:acyl carrier protein
MAVKKSPLKRPAQSAVAKQVIAALGDYLKKDERKLAATLSLREDLGLDSLAIIELLYRIEEAFNLSIPDEDLEKLQTVGDVIAYIERGMGPEKPPRPAAKVTKAKKRR